VDETVRVATQGKIARASPRHSFGACVSTPPRSAGLGEDRVLHAAALESGVRVVPQHHSAPSGELKRRAPRQARQRQAWHRLRTARPRSLRCIYPGRPVAGWGLDFHFHPDPAAAQGRQLPLNRRPLDRDQRPPRGAQRRAKAVHLDHARRPDPRQSNCPNLRRSNRSG
jgi:hypothetical protein